MAVTGVTGTLYLVSTYSGIGGLLSCKKIIKQQPLNDAGKAAKQARRAVCWCASFPAPFQAQGGICAGSSATQQLVLFLLILFHQPLGGQFAGHFYCRNAAWSTTACILAGCCQREFNCRHGEHRTVASVGCILTLLQPGAEWLFGRSPHTALATVQLAAAWQPMVPVADKCAKFSVREIIPGQ